MATLTYVLFSHYESYSATSRTTVSLYDFVSHCVISFLPITVKKEKVVKWWSKCCVTFVPCLRPVGGIAVSYRESNLVGLHVFNGRNWMGKGLTNCCYYGCRKQALYSRFLLQCYTKTWQTILCPCQYKCPQPRGKKPPAQHHPGICHDNSRACLYNYMQQIITVGFI